jgi:hypothetical protein
VNSPLMWPGDTVQELRGTQLFAQLQGQIEELKQSFKRVVRPLKDQSLTFLRWKRAFVQVKALLYYLTENDPWVVPWVSLFSFGAKQNLEKTSTF